MPTPGLEADIEIEGLGESTQSVTELGKALERVELYAGQIGGTLGKYEEAFAGLNKIIEASAANIQNQTETSEAKRRKAEEDAAARAAKSEEESLRSKMASMVGGGINTAAYQQQLQKVQEQIELIKAAEEKQLVSHREAASALDKLNKQYSKLSREAKVYAAASKMGIGGFAASAYQKMSGMPGAITGAVGSQVAGIGTGITG